VKLALAIIAKNEVEKCKDIITKYGKHFDEVCIACDDRFDEFESLEADIHRYEWCDDFAHKRNFF